VQVADGDTGSVRYGKHGGRDVVAFCDEGRRQVRQPGPRRLDMELPHRYVVTLLQRRRRRPYYTSVCVDGHNGAESRIEPLQGVHAYLITERGV